MPPYNVSTITATANVGSPVNLAWAWEHVAIGEAPGVLAVEYAPPGMQEVLKRGSYVRVRPARRKKHRAQSNGRFTNQVTMVIGMPGAFLVNCKVFANGKLQMTGARCETDGRVAAEFAAMALITCGACASPLDVCVSDVQMRLINTDFEVPFMVNNRRLQHLMVKRHQVMCIYEPCIYPGIKLLYYWNENQRVPGVCSCPGSCCQGKGERGTCKKVTIAIFQTGSVIITGATSLRQIDDAYAFTTDLLHTNRADIERIAPGKSVAS